MYRTDFELPDEYRNLPGKNALEKIAHLYQNFDTLDLAIGVYKIYVDDQENIEDVIYIYTNPMMGKLARNDYMWMRGRSYRDTVSGASSKWFDIAAEAGIRNKVIQQTIYAPGLQQFLNFTARQAFAPGYVIITYTAASELTLSDVSIRQAYKTNDLIITISKLLRTSGSLENIMARALEEVWKMMLLDRIYIIELTRNAFVCEYEWRNEGQPSIKNRLKKISSYDLMHGFEVHAKNSSCVNITAADMELQQNNPAFVDFFNADKVTEMIAAPFFYRGKLQGYLVGENPQKEDLLKKELLEAASFFFGAELQSGRLMQKLEYRNRHDLLTNIQNRNAMEKDAEQLQKRGVPIAVLYADLNGLKQLNDEIGHYAGDNAIKTAAKVMADIFHQSNVYRIGGDEFVALLENMQEEQLAQKIAKLLSAAKQRGISLSVGYSCTPDSTNLPQTMKKADTAMYESKKQYYKTHTQYERKY